MDLKTSRSVRKVFMNLRLDNEDIRIRISENEYQQLINKNFICGNFKINKLLQFSVFISCPEDTEKNQQIFSTGPVTVDKENNHLNILITKNNLKKLGEKENKKSGINIDNINLQLDIFNEKKRMV